MRHLDCEFIDSDGKKQYERVYFVESSFKSGTNTVYRLNGFVAKGGNGTVFKCYHSHTNELFAVKILRVLDRVRRERFEFECLVLNDLIHPHILPICDTGFIEMTHRSPIPFMVSTFFSSNIDRLIRNNTHFSISEIKKFGSQICDAFQYLHAEGLVHRDIKPGNFLLEGDRLVVSDFGFAKTYTEDGADRFWHGDMTATDERVGSIPWMSPELFRYAQDKTVQIDHRSDIYQIGRVLWYMYTGDIAGLPDKDDDQSGGKLYDIVMKTIQKKPTKRFQSAEDLRGALNELPDEHSAHSC